MINELHSSGIWGERRLYWEAPAEAERKPSASIRGDFLGTPRRIGCVENADPKGRSGVVGLGEHLVGAKIAILPTSI